MMMQRIKETNRLPRYAAVILFFAVIVGYSLFQARFLILGPGVKITYPADGATIDNEIISLRGTARNAAWLTLNDKQIFTDEQGNWNEELLVSEGLSIMTVKVRDRFGRETEKKIRIYLN